jgi:hypothetical protein
MPEGNQGAYTFLRSVKPEQAPKPPARKSPGGIWKELADKAYADYKAGLVTVILMPDEDALQRLRNSLRIPLRKIDTHVRSVISTTPVDNGQDNGIKVYIRLESTQ